jgi:hypothetical protein
MEIKLSTDWIELLQLFTDNEVDFVVIGAFALAMHGIPRMTGDIDLLYNPSPENCDRMFVALKEFGIPIQSLTASDLAIPDTTISFGRPPNRIDLLNWLSGSSWDDVAADRIRGRLGALEVWYISRRAYLINKDASGRPRDFVDASTVREMYPDENL